MGNVLLGVRLRDNRVVEPQLNLAAVRVYQESVLSCVTFAFAPIVTENGMQVPVCVIGFLFDGVVVFE